MKEIHGDNEENDGVCRALCVVEDEIKFRESTKREREREREVQIEFRVEKSWRVRRDDADDPPGLEISPSLERDGGRERRRRRLVTLVVDVAAPGVATLIDSRGPAPSTDVPVTSLESRHPLPLPTRFDHPALESRVIAPRLFQSRCSLRFPDEFPTINGGRIFGRTRRFDNRVIFVIHICVFRLDSSTSIINSSEIYWYKGEYTISRRL